MMNSKKRKRVVNLMIRGVSSPIQQGYVSSGIGKASFVHALIVIFLEFFAWGLLTDQVITVLNETFPNNTFLANGLIHGVKGILSFLSAPLIGAMSDIWGRKVFLLLSVFFTCLPIPLMRVNTMWYFALISISGIFAVTFSVVFAYVADVTDENSRSNAYGLVSATFAASLITSPAIGSYLSRFYSENFVIALATAVSVFDVFFILVAVPESLPEKLREKSKSIKFEDIDPFKALRNICADPTVSLLCITVFLSYLPEAGQYSCFFVFLKLIVGFSQQEIAYFIAYIGILSCLAQSAVFALLIKFFGKKESIIVGLVFQVMQLALYGLSSKSWIIWFAGLLAAISSITYPAISAFISTHASAESQGVAQGMVTGIRGLCNGIGPALYGLIFWIFHVDLNENSTNNISNNVNNISNQNPGQPLAETRLIPGPPFLFGSILALGGLIIILLLPSKSLFSSNKSETVHHKHSGNSNLLSYESEALIETGDTITTSENTNSLSPLLMPLMIQDSHDFNSSQKILSANVTTNKQQ